MSLPFMPQLESLTACNIHGELLKSILTSPSSSSSTPTLRYLNIESIQPIISVSLRNQYLINVLVVKDCGNLRNISDGIQCLSALEELRISKCEDLDAWDETHGISAWEGMTSLRTLHLSDISKLELLPHGIGGLSNLQHLTMTGLSNLTELPQQIGSLSQLHSLAIFYCMKLTSLPESFLGLTSLQRLKIIKKCQQPDGEDWPLIQHIPSVSFQLFS